MLSLLWYPDFFTQAFPTLETSYRIDLDAERVEKRSYQTSIKSTNTAPQRVIH